MSAPKKPRDPRMGLRTSATLATVFTILGHTVFGFEQPVSNVVVALATGYFCAILFEWIDAKACGDVPGYAGGGVKKFIDFLLSAHMTSITLSFLLYYNQRLWILALTVTLAIGSKYLLRVPQKGRLQHFMNPSNFGIVIVLAVYQWVGVLPWGWTINIHGAWDLIVPLVIVALGIRLNLLFTGRLPLVGAWLASFALQAAFRSWRLDTPIQGQFVILTGITMVLFTLYMITDPQTSPSKFRSQMLFGGGIGIAYSILFDLHIQYTMFYAVTTVCAIRGACLYYIYLRERASVPAAIAVAAGVGAEREHAAPVKQ